MLWYSNFNIVRYQVCFRWICKTLSKAFKVLCFFKGLFVIDDLCVTFNKTHNAHFFFLRKSFARYFSYFDFTVYLGFVVIVSLYLRWNIAIANDTDRDIDGCPVLNLTKFDLNFTDTFHLYELPGIPWSDSVYFVPVSVDNTKGRELNSAATLASQPAASHSLSFIITVVNMTLGWGLFVGLAAESCGRIWLPCLRLRSPVRAYFIRLTA